MIKGHPGCNFMCVLWHINMSYILVSFIGIVTISVVVNDRDRMISLNKTLFSHKT